MNRPKAENHYKDVGGFTYRYETQYVHKTDYERELEAYCDALEKALQKLKDIYESYVDSCAICTRTDCDACCLKDVIEELEEVLLNDE